MRLSAKSDYALRALFFLTDVYRGAESEPVSIRTIAEKNDIPRRFLEQIMIDLRAKHWVRSVAGRDGGFVLGMPPDNITMGDVIRHFDEIIAPIDCVSVQSYRPCSQEPRCRFRRVLLEIRNFTSARMDAATLASVSTASPVTHAEVLQGFADGDGV